jgi:hypothetical protein
MYNNLTESNNKIINPSNISVKLFDHQLTSIYAMLKLEEDGLIQTEHYEIYVNISFLSDKVGAGKTFTILGLISSKVLCTSRNKFLQSGSNISIRQIEYKKAIKTNLIIVPHTIIRQWEETFIKSSIKTYVIKSFNDICDIKDQRYKSDDDEEDNENDIYIQDFDAIIVSSTMFEYFQNKFTYDPIKWSRIIIDEASTIQLPRNMIYDYNFLWLISATPRHVYRICKKNEIFLMVREIRYDMLDDIMVKNSDEYIDKCIILPNMNRLIIKCFTSIRDKIINEFGSNQIIELNNANNNEDLINELGYDAMTMENLLNGLTNKFTEQIKKYNARITYIESINAIYQERGTSERNVDSINELKTKIKDLEYKIECITQRVESVKDTNCPICYDDMNKPIMVNCCNNIFCYECITKCKICPFCRADIEVITFITDKVFEKLRSKIDNLIDIINKKNGKFLIFSNYDKTFNMIKKALDDCQISNSMLIGSNLVINSTIKKYNSGLIKVLMLNARSYGSGLNLQATTDIIIYHELDENLEIQVIGRAHRYGRTEPLNVYYLYKESEIKENNNIKVLEVYENKTEELDKILNYDPINKVDIEVVENKKVKRTRKPKQ